ncbi:MAG TPA: sigma-70 family RNA polymerase sigma factor [Polyangiaceae bacterium]|nr:sigma-70 family RNA polymerase sigma factor [Polyangiaceae bacterium]
MATSPAEAGDRAATTLARTEPALGVPSFHELCARYFDFVWKCARALGAPSDETDDVVQDVFLVVQRRAADLKEERLARSWIYGIVRRVVSSHRRQRRDRGVGGGEPDVDSLSSSQPSPFAAAERSSEVNVLMRLLDGLDERKREVFVLSEILEMSGNEIAETIGVPMNTVYSRLRAAREEFDAAALRERKSLERKRAL